jgi:autotransporter-associated beta strand protein
VSAQRTVFLAGFCLLFAVLVPLVTHAQTMLYWDINGTTAGAGGTTPSGTWKTSGAANQNWNTVANGTGTTGTWVNDDIAVFSAGSDATGSFTITVATGNTVDSIIVQSGNITFNSSPLTLTGTVPSIDVAAGSSAIFNTKISGSNGLVKNGAGTLYLYNGGTNYTGDTVINAGTLDVGGTNTILPATTAMTIAAGATFQIEAGGTKQSVGSLSGAGTLNISDSSFTAGDVTSTTFSGSIIDGGAGGTFTKAGSGTLTLSGSSTYTGATLVNDGTLVVSSSGGLGAASSGNIVASGASLQLTGGITLNETDLTLKGTGFDGNGVLRNLSGNNTFNSALILSANSTIASTSGALTLNGDANIGTHTLTTTGAGDVVLNGAVSGSGGKLIQDGTGTLTLSGSTANTFTGTTSVNNGTLYLAKTAGVNALGAGAITVGDGVGAANSANLVFLASNQLTASTAAITLNSDGRLALNTFSQSINTVTGTGQIDLGTTGHLTIGANNGSSTFGGSITGAGELTKAGSGTLTFNSSITFTGTLTIASGTVALNGYTVSAGTLHITGNSILDFGNSAASFLNVTNLLVDTGVTLTINNWVDAVDYFTVLNNPGGSQGNPPLNQILFTGGSYTVNDTKWLPYDHQITPAPEPATYGAILAGFSTLLLAWRRRRALA